MSSASTYDEIPYSDYIFFYTRPEISGAVAQLLGMNPARPEHCRVLELGSGMGVNLVCMAEDNPGSHFVGIDASGRQVEAARRLASSVGRDNVEFHAIDLMEMNPGLGAFDYIICHGVYSWVPSQVQAKILAICKEHLAPAGVAFVSYNTYPGWHVRGMFREMMSFHVAQFDNAAERVAQARALLEFLAETVGSRGTLFGSLLQIEADLLQRSPDTYIYHEHLEEVNSPVYFHEFARRAGDQGLQYLAEATPAPLAQNLSAEACATIQRMSTSLIRGEQYLDFVRNRTFRRTLLCRDDVVLKRPLSPARLGDLYVGSELRALGATDPANPNAETFETPDSGRLTIGHPLVRTGLNELIAAWPAVIAVSDLWDRVQARLGPQNESVRLEFAQNLIQIYLARFIEFRMCKPLVALAVSERPKASPLAQYRAAADERATALRYGDSLIEPFDRAVLLQLDGTRDRAALVDAIAGQIANGALDFAADDAARADPEQMRQAIASKLETSLTRLARNGLLIA